MEVDSEHDSQHDSQHSSQHGDSETEISPSESHTAGSHAWNYFTKDANFKQNKKATCNICSKTYVCSGGSTLNLTSHLQRIQSEFNLIRSNLIFLKSDRIGFESNLIRSDLCRILLINKVL